jgi:acyl-CoA synthetase (AMP-forming)/AMP-acid ligase II
MKSLEQLLGQVGSGCDPVEREIDAKNGIDVDQPQTLAQIVYTSGTESLPKGAMLSHGAILSQYVSCVIDAEVRAEDKLLHALPLYHCAQLDVFFGPSIYVAAQNIIAARPVPSQLIALIEQHQINSFFAPPTVWIGMLRDPGFSPQRLGSLRKAYYRGLDHAGRSAQGTHFPASAGALLESLWAN